MTCQYYSDHKTSACTYSTCCQHDWCYCPCYWTHCQGFPLFQHYASWHHSDATQAHTWKAIFRWSYISIYRCPLSLYIVHISIRHCKPLGFVENIVISSSIFNMVTPRGICRTGRVHVYFRCRRLCVFTALWAIFRVQELRKKYL